MWRGRGESLRVRPFSVGGTTRGARFVVRDDPSEALASMLVTLQHERFDLGDERVRRALAARGSEWVGHDVRIGPATPGATTGLVDAALSQTLLSMVPGLWRRATPTVVIASARPHAEGAEVVVFAHPATRGWSSANDAGPLLDAAFRRYERHEGARLVSRERISSIPNDGSPASQAFVRDVLDWR